MTSFTATPLPLSSSAKVGDVACAIISFLAVAKSFPLDVSFDESIVTNSLTAIFGVSTFVTVPVTSTFASSAVKLEEDNALDMFILDCFGLIPGDNERRMETT